MLIGDNKYNEHFRHMVIEAMCCGLDHPVEWIESYSRCIAQKQELFIEIDEFCTLAYKELYAYYNSLSKKPEDVTINEINEWINNHYGQ